MRVRLFTVNKGINIFNSEVESILAALNTLA